MRNLTVGKLRKLIEGVADDVPVVLHAADHAYRYNVDGEVTTALFDPRERCMTEDYGEEDTPEEEFGKRINVLLIS